MDIVNYSFQDPFKNGGMQIFLRQCVARKGVRIFDNEAESFDDLSGKVNGRDFPYIFHGRYIPRNKYTYPSSTFCCYIVLTPLYGLWLHNKELDQPSNDYDWFYQST